MELDESKARTILGHERTQVRLVNVLYPIRYHGIRNDEQIKLDDELPFLWGIVFCIPVPKGSSLAFSVHIEQANISRSNFRFQCQGPMLRTGNKGDIYQISGYAHAQATLCSAYQWRALHHPSGP